MKKQVVLIFLLLLTISATAQDIVVNKKGQRFDCFISREDSGAVFFNYYRNQLKVDTFIVRNDLESYQYGSQEPMPRSNAKTCLSMGLLLGGSTWAGVDFELLLSDRIGVQVGGGYLGAAGGINYHFSPSIRSSYVSFNYWCQGIGNNKDWGYKQTIIGPAIVFRGRSWLTAQVGVGYILDKGPAFDDDLKNNVHIGLTFGIGGYLPL